jgi:hypothetical protein
MRPSSDHLRREAKAFLKEAIWFATTHHVPGPKRDILLFCTRRGGSTFVMEAIAADRGVKYLDQPLEITTESMTAAKSRAIPKFESGELVHLDSDEEKVLRDYIESILDGSVPVNAPWRFWRRDFEWRTDRLVLKIVSAKALIDWFATSFDVDVVYVTRHPIPQALSCIRNGWSLTAKPYLRNEWFVSTYLDDVTLARCWDLLRTGSPLEQFVLNWALENVVPLRLLDDRPAWTYLSYEATVLEPVTIIPRLASALDLDDVDAMLRATTRPSRSSGLSDVSTRASIEAGDRDALLRSWRSKVSADEERDAMAILDRLGVDLYRPGDDLPRLLHRIPDRAG